MPNSLLTATMCLREAILLVHFEFARRSRDRIRDIVGPPNLWVMVNFDPTVRLDDWSGRASPLVSAAVTEVIEGRWALGCAVPMEDDFAAAAWERYGGVGAVARLGEGRLEIGFYIERVPPVLTAYKPGRMASLATQRRNVRSPTITVQDP